MFLGPNIPKWKNIPNDYKPYQIAINGRKILVIKYTNIFHSKALQNIPKLGYLV
jgi:hypothetical protein